MLLTPHLWTGITKVRPGAGVAIVGNPEQVADTIRQFIDAGCHSFCLSGYPHDQEATRFGELVRPLLSGKIIVFLSNRTALNNLVRKELKANNSLKYKWTDLHIFLHRFL